MSFFTIHCKNILTSSKLPTISETNKLVSQQLKKLEKCTLSVKRDEGIYTAMIQGGLAARNVVLLH